MSQHEVMLLLLLLSYLVLHTICLMFLDEKHIVLRHTNHQAPLVGAPVPVLQLLDGLTGFKVTAPYLVDGLTGSNVVMTGGERSDEVGGDTQVGIGGGIVGITLVSRHSSKAHIRCNL